MARHGGGGVRGKDVALLVGVALLWGFNFIPIRWALDEVPPFLLVALRFLLAAVPMVFFVPRPRVPPAVLVAYGLAIGVGQFGLLYLAIRLGAPVGLASLIIQVQVFFTIGLAALVARDRIRARPVVGAIVAATGLILLAYSRGRGGGDLTSVGLVLIIGAAASWAVGNVVAKRAAALHGADSFQLVVWSSLVSPLPLAAMSFALEGGVAPFLALADASLLAWACILLMSYGATIWGYSTWNRMLERYPASLVTPFALLVPVAGLASAALVLGERFGWVEAVASALVLAGLAIALVSPPGRAARDPAEAAAHR